MDKSRVTGRAKKIVPRPPPLPYSQPPRPAHVPSNVPQSSDDERNQMVCRTETLCALMNFYLLLFSSIRQKSLTA